MNTTDLGQMVAHLGLLLSRLKFLMLATPMMELSSLRTLSSSMPSTTIKSVTCTQPGTILITRKLAILVAQAPTHLLFPPLKKFTSWEIYTISECTLLIASSITPKALSVSPKDQPRSAPQPSLTNLALDTSTILLSLLAPTRSRPLSLGNQPM
jgi:hypothetical protein